MTKRTFDIFTCGFSPGIRTGSVQWIKFWLFTFSKNYKSSDRAGYFKQREWKTQLEIFAIPGNLEKCQVLCKPILRKFLSGRNGYIKQKVWKTQLDKSWGNKYLEIFSFDRDGYIKRKVWKKELEIFAILGNLKKRQVLWKPILRKFLSGRNGFIKQKVWKTQLEIFAIPGSLKKLKVLRKPELRIILSDRNGYIKQKVWKT